MNIENEPPTRPHARTKFLWRKQAIKFAWPNVESAHVICNTFSLPSGFLARALHHEILLVYKF